VPPEIRAVLRALGNSPAGRLTAHIRLDLARGRGLSMINDVVAEELICVTRRNVG
jgi:hypothetical protein